MRDRVYTRLHRLRTLGLIALPLLTALPVLTFAPAVADTLPVVADAMPVNDAVTQDPLDILTRWQTAPDTVFDAAEVIAADLAYHARILVIFAEAEAQPQFRDQLALITARVEELTRRDVIIITDADPANPSALRQQLRPRGFSLVLLDKDGTVVFRKPDPWDVREIGRQIDKLPSRLQEVRG